MPGRFTVDLVALPSPAVLARGYFLTAERLNHLSEPLLQVAEDFSKEIEINFEVEGRPAPWEPLKEATLESKTGLDPRILRASGGLFKGVTAPDSWDVSMAGTNQAAAVLTDPTSYGKFHVTGTDFMDARDWSFIPDDALARADETFVEWMMEQVAA